VIPAIESRRANRLNRFGRFARFRLPAPAKPAIPDTSGAPEPRRFLRVPRLFTGDELAGARLCVTPGTDATLLTVVLRAIRASVA
jgi:hypothetical protein